MISFLSHLSSRCKASLVVLAACALPAQAEEEVAEKGQEWKVTVQPYIWGLGNKVRIANEQYDRSDYTGYIQALTEQYQYGFLWTTSAYKGKWGLYMDGHFVRLKDEALEFGILPYKSDIWQMLFEGAAVRRFGTDERYVELFAGARYFRMDSTVEVTIAGTFEDLFQWVEPMAGARAGMALDDEAKWKAEISGDVGGFEVGSDFTWQASATLSYRLSPRRTVSVGYRHIDLEFHDGVRRYESEMSGPLVGFGIEF